MNLKAKKQRLDASLLTRSGRASAVPDDESRIKAVTVMFSDLEGRLHMLDYDKKFLLNSYDNLTSTVPRFALHRATRERFAFGHRLVRFLLGPADIFDRQSHGVCEVIDKGGEPYAADMRGVLKTSRRLYKKHKLT